MCFIHIFVILKILTMKKLLLIGLLTFAFSSCEKDNGSNNDVDEPDPTTEAEANFNYDIIEFNPFQVQMENLSTGALNYVWDFGDNGSSIEVNPIYEYSQIDEFLISLNAKDANGLDDAVQKKIQHPFFDDPEFNEFPLWDQLSATDAVHFMVDDYEFIFIDESGDNEHFAHQPKISDTPSGQGSISEEEVTYQHDLKTIDGNTSGWSYTNFYFKGLEDITDPDSEVEKHYKIFSRIINNQLDYMFIKKII